MSDKSYDIKFKAIAYQNALVCHQPNKFWNFNPQK